MNQERVDIDTLQDTYQTLLRLIGVQNMLLVYEHFQGMQVAFPIHLYSREKVKQLLAKDINIDTAQFARDYGYTEKWVRKTVNEIRKDDTHENQ